MGAIKEFGERLIGNLEQVIVGKRNSLELVVIGLLCQGHILIEDVPGVGKTMLARSLAKSLDCSFNRIQFTPDMLPSDVTGVSIYNQQKRVFEFRPGPIMGQIILADEVNHATPKTQAALLESIPVLFSKWALKRSTVQIVKSYPTSEGSFSITSTKARLYASSALGGRPLFGWLARASTPPLCQR